MQDGGASHNVRLKERAGALEVGGKIVKCLKLTPWNSKLRSIG
jgi:hypothetical protein